MSDQNINIFLILSIILQKHHRTLIQGIKAFILNGKKNIFAFFGCFFKQLYSLKKTWIQALKLQIIF